MRTIRESVLDDFLGIEEKENEQEVCDSKTGECFTIKTKDGIVERINKKFIVEDGRELLQD